ncbi:MAG: acyl-phosphate glycerol 3-phosphate acyltransferase [Candidatus Rokuibacteriota bacterium]|nr:MAG: acyl-phosphate glycerol 3-phosphate acyltransferase [Candidatus Rokubacteria bacterium]
MVVIAAIVGAYLIGAVPIGWLVARAFGVSDIRRHGSGTIGATNVLRTLGRLPAIVTLLGDVLKGYVAVALAARFTQGDPVAVALATVAAVVGNCWSVFLGFRGGKGVATGLGALLRLVPWATLAALPVFVAVVATSRFVSLGSLLGALCVPLGAALLGYPRASVIAAVAVALIVVGRHHANIARLRAGTESRLGQKSTA